MPKGEAAVTPANGEGVDSGVPLHLGDLVLAARDLEVGLDGALVVHKNDAGFVGRDRQLHVDFAVGPGR